MLILKHLLHQVALYWDVGELTESGRRDYSAITPIEIPVHWTNEVTYETTVTGQVIKATSKVLTSYEVKQHGVLWLSTATSRSSAGTALLQVPANVPTNQTIEYVERHYSISVDETLYKAYI